MSGESELVIVEEPSSPPNESPEVKERFRAPSSGHFVVTTDKKWVRVPWSRGLDGKIEKTRTALAENKD